MRTMNNWKVCSGCQLAKAHQPFRLPLPPLNHYVIYHHIIPYICLFFTQAKFLENKIHTKIYTVNCQFDKYEVCIIYVYFIMIMSYTIYIIVMLLVELKNVSESFDGSVNMPSCMWFNLLLSLPKIVLCKILFKRFKISLSLLLDGVISAIWLLRVGW